MAYLPRLVAASFTVTIDIFVRHAYRMQCGDWPAFICQNVLLTYTSRFANGYCSCYGSIADVDPLASHLLSFQRTVRTDKPSASYLPSSSGALNSLCYMPTSLTMPKSSLQDPHEAFPASFRAHEPHERLPYLSEPLCQLGQPSATNIVGTSLHPSVTDLQSLRLSNTKEEPRFQDNLAVVSSPDPQLSRKFTKRLKRSLIKLARRVPTSRVAFDAVECAIGQVITDDHQREGLAAEWQTIRDVRHHLNFFFSMKRPLTVSFRALKKSCVTRVPQPFGGTLPFEVDNPNYLAYFVL